MVPIYDTDVAEERWSKAEWEQYELWEKVELRLKRRKRLWVLGTFLLFLTLFSLPIIAEQRPKRASLYATRRIAQEINRMKVEAGLNRSAYRLQFLTPSSYEIVRLNSCAERAGQVVRSGSFSECSEIPLKLLDMNSRETEGLPGLVREFCYDPISGSEPANRGENVVGFAVQPEQAARMTENGAPEGALSSTSLLLLSGSSAEISFE